MEKSGGRKSRATVPLKTIFLINFFGNILSPKHDIKF
jgi:hypothetical protein